MRPASTAPSRRPRVVVVGAGFGGLAAARALKSAAVDVTVIDRTNHHLFQPLLYQVATGVLSPAEIASPTRFVLGRQRNVEVLMAAVERVDLARRCVVLEAGPNGGPQEVPYDFLVLATGARHAYFGHPEWEEHAPGLKSLEDARRIRTRFLRALEVAERTTDPAERAALLTFVVVGAGPTGVELAGILPTIARTYARKTLRNVDPAEVRVLLLEGGPRVLSTFDPSLSERARRDLEELGAEVRTNTIVTDVRDDAVYVGEERIEARTTFWAAGNEASPLLRSLGVPLDKAGRALVEPDLSVPGHPEAFVVGDAAAARIVSASEEAVDARSWQGGAWKDVPGAAGAAPGAPPTFVPGVAPAATQMGKHAASTIERAISGEPPERFRYNDKGNLAVIGRNRAVAEIGGSKLGGWLAWTTWLFVHILYLVGFRNRAVVLLSWGYAYFANRPNAGLITSDVDAPHGADAALLDGSLSTA